MKKMQKSRWYLLTSFCLAVILFLYTSMANYQSSTSSKITSETYTNTIYNVPIDIEYDSDKYFISGFSSDVTVQLTSSNRITLQKESQEATRSFTVTADLSEYTSGTHDFSLKITNVPSGVTATVNPSSITVKIGKRVTKTIDVKGIVPEDQIESGITVSSISTGNTKVEVTTDEDTMSNIDHVEAVLPAETTLSDNYSGKVTLQAVDSSGNVLSANINPEETNLEVKVKKN